jgi:hypothetical protein
MLRKAVRGESDEPPRDASPVDPLVRKPVKIISGQYAGKRGLVLGIRPENKLSIKFEGSGSVVLGREEVEAL